MKVAVVILNWNGIKFLEQFLPSVITYNTNYSKVILADNASTDNSVAFTEKNYPSVEIIKNSSNGGFSKGYNDALKQVDAEYYILLNSDVEVTRGWIDKVILLMDSDTTIAACQPKIKAYADKKMFEYAGAAGGFIDKFGYPFCRGRILAHIEEDNGQYDDVREIFWATGACLFVRAKCYHEVNGFDEDLFAHMEEIDLCWRLKNRGYKIMYCPDATVYHVGGGTLNKNSSKKTYLNFRNNLILICKNHPSRYIFFKLITRMILDAIAAIKFLITGQFIHSLAVLRAHASFYWMLPATLKKRKIIKKQIKEYTTTAVYLHSIVADFYLRGKKTFKEIDFKERFE
ncbi:MAG: glycosyltransferase family 2 protein [Bacteroidia bacterium]